MSEGFGIMVCGHGSRDENAVAEFAAVATAMREMGLESKITKAFTPTTTKSDPTKQPAANVLDRDFTADAPNRKWVTDITYLPTAAGWVYLAVVLDLFSRKVVGWSLGYSLATELVSNALRAAIESRRQLKTPYPIQTIATPVHSVLRAEPDIHSVHIQVVISVRLSSAANPAAVINPLQAPRSHSCGKPGHRQVSR